MLYEDIKRLVKKLVLNLVEVELDRRMDKEFGSSTKARAQTKSRLEQVIDTVRSRAARKAAVTRRKQKTMHTQDEKIETTESTPTAVSSAPPSGAAEVKTGGDGKTQVWQDGVMLFARARPRDALREARKRSIRLVGDP